MTDRAAFAPLARPSTLVGHRPPRPGMGNAAVVLAMLWAPVAIGDDRVTVGLAGV